MRLWSLHPKYLDVKGLCGLWREGIWQEMPFQVLEKAIGTIFNLKDLKERKILQFQLIRIYVYEESKRRNYNFNRERIGNKFQNYKIEVTDGQLNYKMKHLKRKLKERDKDTKS